MEKQNKQPGNTEEKDENSPDTSATEGEAQGSGTEAEHPEVHRPGEPGSD